MVVFVGVVHTRQTQVSRDDDASGNDRAVFREKTYQVVALRRGRRSSHCASAHPVEFKKRKQQRVPGPSKEYSSNEYSVE